MRRFARASLGGILAVAIAVGGGLWLTARPSMVEVAMVERDLPVRIFGLGTVEARILSRIGFSVGGAIVELNADHGDMVARGTVLARLDNAEQAARVTKAEAALSQARANRERARAGVARAEALFAQRRSASERRVALAGRGAGSEEAAEDAKAAAEIAAAELAVARSEVAVADAVLGDAEAQFRIETILLEQHILRAPYNSLVISRTKELGAVVAPTEAVFTLIDPTTVWALAYVDEAQAGLLALGQQAEVRLRSLPRQTFEARIERIDVESDRVTEERRVYVKCSACPERFYLGEQAEVFLIVARLPEALAVPETMIDGFDGIRGVVWTVEDGVLRRRPLIFGHRLLDGRAIVADGLPVGASVVIATRSGLKEGRAARVIGDADP